MAQVKRIRRNVSGIILLDKPLGFTSNAALQKVRWLLNAEKAGHPGTQLNGQRRVVGQTGRIRTQQLYAQRHAGTRLRTVLQFGGEFRSVMLATSIPFWPLLPFSQTPRAAKL